MPKRLLLSGGMAAPPGALDAMRPISSVLRMTCEGTSAKDEAPSRRRWASVGFAIGQRGRERKIVADCRRGRGC